MNIFEKWNKNIDVEGLKNDIAEADNGNQSGEYREVPVGDYEVKVEKMEIKESKKGDPMFFCQFRIVAGDFEKSCLFMNQVITQGFQISIVKRFLKSLDVVEDVVFEDYNQFNDLIMDMMEEIDANGLEYLLEFKKGKNDFNVFTIKEVYE